MVGRGRVSATGSRRQPSVEGDFLTGDRRGQLLARLERAALEDQTQVLCDMCADVTGTSGAGIMLMTDDVRRGSLATTNAVSDLVEELQYSLGEGPCVDAYHENRPVAEPDLAQPSAPRWLAFSGPAIAAGVRAIFGFPLQVGSSRLGALDLYNDQPGPLTDSQHADALMMAGIAAETVLRLQADAPAGELAEALQTNADFQFVVHNAAGMVSVQLDITVTQAILRLRAYAFSHEQPLPDVARDVIERRLRFDE